jgi:hypothetical protein
LLYAALIALALALYRAVLPDAPHAALAGLLFAIDEAHGMPVGWLANRSALFAAVFGMTAVLLHHRAARGWRPGWVLAPAALALALLSGEMGLGAFGYLVAYALAYDNRALPARLLSLLPLALTVAGWAAARHQLGFGVRGSDFYVDPSDAPMRFLSAFPGRLLAMTLAQLAAPASDLCIVWQLLSWPALAALIAAAVAALTLFGWVAWPVLRANRGARFCALGMVLALCPTTATIPSDRNLLLAGVGAFGLIALMVGRFTVPGVGVARWVRGGLIGLHLFLAPLFLPVTSFFPGVIDLFSLRAIAPLRGDPPLRDQMLVQVNTTTMVMTAFYLATPDSPGQPAPARIRTLATTDDPFTLEREDERTVRLTLEPGYFVEPTSGVVRSRTNPLREGERVELPRTTYTVLRVDERGQPLSIRCRFDVPLDDPSLRWVQWNGKALVAFHPPAIGESIRVEH